MWRWLRTPTGIDSAARAVDASEKQVFAAMAIAQERFLGDKHEFDATLQAIRDWQPIRADVIRAMKSGDRETGATITKTKGAVQVKLIAERMDALVMGVKYRAANFAESRRKRVAGQDPGDIGAHRHDHSGRSIAWLITHSIRGPISQLRVVMERLAKQDYSAEVPFTANTNEIGQIAKAVEFFKENGLAVEHLRNEQARMKAEGEALRKKQILDLADDFEFRRQGGGGACRVRRDGNVGDRQQHVRSGGAGDAAILGCGQRCGRSVRQCPDRGIRRGRIVRVDHRNRPAGDFRRRKRRVTPSSRRNAPTRSSPACPMPPRRSVRSSA